jgi:Flp pilus assembly protein TadD
LLNIKRGNLKLAEKVLSELITYCPNYAEGYNQRAFARYLDLKFEKALFDLQVALDLRPRHLGALSGKALTHVALGQEVEAQIELRKALALNPFIPEREMIKDLGTDL